MKVKLLAIVVLLVVGGAALVMALGGLPRSAAASATYLTANAAVADVSDDVAATGSIAASTTWSLEFGVAPTTGTASTASSTASTGTWTVRAVKVKVGDTVKAKDLLATATDPTLAASITAARNDVTSANLQLLQAQDAYDAATTTSAIRQTRASLLGAKNGVAQAWATYADLRETAARSSLVAPAAGIVTAVAVTPGMDAPSGAAITLDSTDYQVTADVVESDVSSIKVGQLATVTVAAIGADLAGTVTTIAPTAVSSSSSNAVVSYAVTVQLASPPAALRPGMSANVTITTSAASGVLAVPAAAIRGTNGNYSVQVVTAAGTPEARAVTVGLMTSALVEIRSGLNAGDAVVIGTTSTQRTTTGTGFGAGGGIVVPGGGGGGGFRGGGGGGGN